MKLNLILLLLILLCSCGPNSPENSKGTEKLIDIIDARYFFLNKFIFHKDKEVKIYYVGTLHPNDNPNYGLYVYRKGIGQTGRFIFLGHYKYDKADYKWVNDTTLNFKLFNSFNHLSDNYTFTYSLDGHRESLGIN